MTENNILKDMPKEKILELLNFNRLLFDQVNIREGDTSTSIYFFNVKNSCSCIITILAWLIENYQLDFNQILKIPNN